MIDQATYKREKRRLATARNRFTKARAAVPNNPYSNELEGSGIQRLGAAVDSARALARVAKEGLELFEDVGYPDAWAQWSVDLADANFYLGRNS